MFVPGPLGPLSLQAEQVLRSSAEDFYGTEPPAAASSHEETITVTFR